MKLYLQKDDGEKVEISEVSTLNKDSEMLFFFLNSHYRKSDIESIEIELKNKTGRQCIALDSVFANKIMGI